MEFIGNRWIFTGPSRYVVEQAEAGHWLVVLVNAAGRKPVYTGSEGACKAMAERL